jgi:class 3 adenylate cyclase
MNDAALPLTRYAFSGDISIAYQVMGQADYDIVIVPGMVSHVEMAHESPGYTAFLRRLSTFARVIAFDKRGQGLSDRISGAPTLEERVDDFHAVMDAVSSKRAVVIGFSEGGSMSAVFAATYPERVSKLLIFGGFANAANLTDDTRERISRRVEGWGTGEGFKTLCPSRAANPAAIELAAKFERLSASPGGIKAVSILNCQIDIRPTLSLVQAPTLIMHRRGDRQVPIAAGRVLAEKIPNARFVEYEGEDHLFWTGSVDLLLGDIEEFVTGHREYSLLDLDRVLATVLFMDIVNSTRIAGAMGDQTWRHLLDNHDQLARQAVDKHRGKLIKTTGDGILATFDGPARAIKCAMAFGAAAKQIGLSIRAGLHTGEVELRGNDIGGIAVHAAARVMAQSWPDEILVSRVVSDLVAGAGLKFTDRGSHELKGLPGRWDLFAAAA